MKFKLLTHSEYRSYLNSLNKLFNVTFKREINPALLEWRYLNNPYDDLLVAVAIENNEIVANYSASPLQISKNGEIVKAAISMTTMTHPDYMGRGLFPLLADMLYNEMKRKNYKLIYGFPNNNSHGSFINKLQWKDIYEIPTFSLLLEDYLEKKIDSSYEFYNDETFLKIYNEIESKQEICLHKDQSYYKWRYAANPENDYYNLTITNENEVVGNLIYKKYGQAIDILEINGISDAEKEYLVIHLINTVKNSNTGKINSWLSVYDTFHRTLEKLGFKNNEPITYFSYKLLNGIDGYEKYGNWKIQMGDSDVY